MKPGLWDHLVLVMKNHLPCFILGWGKSGGPHLPPSEGSGVHSYIFGSPPLDSEGTILFMYCNRFLWFLLFFVIHCTHKRLAGLTIMLKFFTLICANILPTTTPLIAFQWDRFLLLKTPDPSMKGVASQTKAGKSWNVPSPPPPPKKTTQISPHLNSSQTIHYIHIY